MKYYEEFARSGHSFEERIGKPEEDDAAMGRIALAFSLLEDAVCELVHFLIGTDASVSLVITAGLSFRQRLDLFAGLARHHLGIAPEEEAVARLGEILGVCRQAEELRNTYMHSSYSLDRGTRTKTRIHGSQGLRVRTEQVDSGLLLDVADFITHTAMTCQGVPVDLGFADRAFSSGDTVTYFRGDVIIGTSKYL